MKRQFKYVGRNLRYVAPWNWTAGAKAIYRKFFRTGVFLSKSELAMCSLHPVRKVEMIVGLVNPRSILDVGCGTGKTTAYLHRRGFIVIGVEASGVAIRNSEVRELILHHDLRVPLDLGKRFDLVWCFEVAEHIHPKFVDIFVDSLVRHSDTVALSAAPPGQGGEGHFNEQPPPYWEKKFIERGYELQTDWTAAMQAVDEFYSENILVFTNTLPTRSDQVMSEVSRDRRIATDWS